MTHLSDEEIYLIAEATDEQLVYDKDQLEWMNHLKTCKTCYDRFCSLIVLLEVTGESGYVFLSEIYGMTYAKKQMKQNRKKILAIIEMARNKISENIDILFHQTNNSDNVLFFQPSLSMATRGLSDSPNTLYKIEDINDEKTFIAIDSKSNNLLVQVNARKLGEVVIQVYLQLESGKKTEIPMIMKNKIYKGLLYELPKEKFQIYIEAIDYSEAN